MTQKSASFSNNFHQDLNHFLQKFKQKICQIHTGNSTKHVDINRCSIDCSNVKVPKRCSNFLLTSREQGCTIILCAHNSDKSIDFLRRL